MFHKRLLKEFRENQKLVAGMVMAQWAAMLANAALIWTAAGALGEIQRKEFDAEEILRLFLILVGTVLVKGILNTFCNSLSFSASSAVKRKLRERIYSKLMQLGASYRRQTRTSEIVQITTEGVDQLEIYFGKYIPQFFYSMLAPLTLFLIVGSMNLQVAVVLLLCVPLIPVSIVAVQKFAKRMLNQYWGTYTELGDSFLENLQGLTTLKIYQADGRYAKKMDEEAERFRRITMRVLIMQLNSISIMDLAAYGGAAAGIILSIIQFRADNLTLEQCFFIILISAEFFLPLRLLGSFFHIAMNGNAAADKIFRLLDLPVTEKGKCDRLTGGDIRFERVGFGYTEEKEVLKDISFTVKENSFTALAGVSGCGKSTAASLIMGREVPSGGKVLIGGREVSDITEDCLYSTVTRIGHESYLFQGTVEENLRMGNPEASGEQLWNALSQVNLYDTVREKGGLSMWVEEKAANLSGGQRQRLALARAILHDSDIYIFDEATSNIDADSENEIMQAVRKLAETKTVILISHRLANVVAADQILMMEGGRVAESGTHKELMRQEGPYSRLYSVQKELEKYAGGGLA